MLSEYGFKELSTANSFEDRCSSDIIYFPIDDSESFPMGIREKAEELINELIGTGRNGSELDLSESCLEARVEVYFSKDNIPVSNISVLIAVGNDAGFWLDKEYEVGKDDSLYEPFKKHILRQLEKCLFMA